MADCNYVMVTDFGTYNIKNNVLISDKGDRRTRTGKLKHRYDDAFRVLSLISFELDVELLDILPNRGS